jgi:hypothetical protein
MSQNHELQPFWDGFDEYQDRVPTDRSDSGDAIGVREGRLLFGYGLHLIDGSYASSDLVPNVTETGSPKKCQKRALGSCAVR